jgi:hypothetical protein
MAQFEVVFLDEPQVGQAAHILCRGQVGPTPVITWVQRHPTKQHLYRAMTNQGHVYVGAHDPYALARTPPPPTPTQLGGSAVVPQGAVLPPDCIGAATGCNGQIELYEDYVVIKRRGFLAFMVHGFKGEKQIYLDQVSAIQFKQCGTLTSGYLQVVFKGSQESKAALWDATTDENTVVFWSQHEPAFLDLKVLLENRLRQARSGRGGAPLSVADEIAKLDELRRRGVLTDDEFEIKKRQLLGI